ncbi:Uncharacterised protein [Slackia heliotrinireducens]|uniref:Molybdopterin-binding protein n=1 Tax=Slackia heliotrinireducens (strain ATCC 29202 / DSM 20476 / NCTC 11029 / RHS 1) TaxID=471855 RepID=C7N711_SLAHD|nr:hypothetical protein [Slackia heliotrinireducens]ACV22696.1 hypothetical protein Shel_16770 [Slackia heliotrinireducens DSM 20476]VEH01298.1 Uncharacterised protein [Slackia heliotrinireducens]
MIPQVVCEAGHPVLLKGYAIDVGHAVSAVQFSLDDGRNWTTYPTENTDDERRVNWSFVFTPPQAGVFELKVRSVNDEGRCSPQVDTVYISAS